MERVEGVRDCAECNSSQLQLCGAARDFLLIQCCLSMCMSLVKTSLIQRHSAQSGPLPLAWIWKDCHHLWQNAAMMHGCKDWL